MSTVECGTPGQPDLLEYRGPFLSVQISRNSDFAMGVLIRPDLSQELLPALVDTGADTTCIDSDLASSLGLPVVNQETVSGVLGSGVANFHLARIYVPELDVAFSGAFVGAHLSAGGRPYLAIIGRDFLRHFRLSYDGRTGAVTLSND